MRGRLFIVFVGMFMIGWLSNNVYSGLFDETIETPVSYKPVSTYDLDSPSDWIKKEQIHVYKDQVIIDIDNPVWAEYTDTNSMDPLLDITAHGIELVPQTASNINVGDVISYKSSLVDGVLIHRVIEKGYDEEGYYFRTKGDNNQNPDPEKIRFNQVTGVLVGVIY